MGSSLKAMSSPYPGVSIKVICSGMPSHWSLHKDPKWRKQKDEVRSLKVVKYDAFKMATGNRVWIKGGGVGREERVVVQEIARSILIVTVRRTNCRKMFVPCLVAFLVGGRNM